MGLKDVKNIDYTKKENQTFKNWFWFCMSNLWIPLSVLGLTLLTLQITYISTILGWIKDSFIEEGFFTGVFVCAFMPIPFLIAFLSIMKGCVQHWQDVCNGTSR